MGSNLRFSRKRSRQRLRFGAGFADHAERAAAWAIRESASKSKACPAGRTIRARCPAPCPSAAARSLAIAERFRAAPIRRSERRGLPRRRRRRRRPREFPRGRRRRSARLRRADRCHSAAARETGVPSSIFAPACCASSARSLDQRPALDDQVGMFQGNGGGAAVGEKLEAANFVDDAALGRAAQQRAHAMRHYQRPRLRLEGFDAFEHAHVKPRRASSDAVNNPAADPPITATLRAPVRAVKLGSATVEPQNAPMSS